MNNNTLLKVTNLTKYYISSMGAKCNVFENLNFEIYEGETIFITGESGAGKTTLLHILGGLDRPCDGNVYFQEKALPYDDDKTMAKIRNLNFGFVFQFHHLLPEFTVMENIMMPSRIIDNLKEKEIYTRAYNFLEMVGLVDKADNFPLELSGGERQRVSVLRAMMNNPDVIFADEPTGNLDPKNTEAVYRLLRNGSNKKLTLIIVTHSQDLPITNARRVVLEQGKLK